MYYYSHLPFAPPHRKSNMQTKNKATFPLLADVSESPWLYNQENFIELIVF